MEPKTLKCGVCKKPKPFLLDWGICKENLVGKTSLKKFWILLLFLLALGIWRPCSTGLRQLVGLSI